MSYLGIDIGTSGVKAILIDGDGRPLGEASARAVEPVRPHPGWSEQNPNDWWTATLEAVDRLQAAHPAALAATRARNPPSRDGDFSRRRFHRVHSCRRRSSARSATFPVADELQPS